MTIGQVGTPGLSDDLDLFRSTLIGPSNILRGENETNVFIPCPYLGPYNPVWTINGIDYEVFSIPNLYKAARYGLLIEMISKEMNGTTFQCHVSTGQVEGNMNLLSSSIGTLIVHSLL